MVTSTLMRAATRTVRRIRERERAGTAPAIVEAPGPADVDPSALDDDDLEHVIGGLERPVTLTSDHDGGGVDGPGTPG